MPENLLSITSSKVALRREKVDAETITWGFNKCDFTFHIYQAERKIPRGIRSRRQTTGCMKRVLKGVVGKKQPSKRELKLMKNKNVWFVIIFVSKIKMAWAGSKAIDLFENYNWSRN